MHKNCLILGIPHTSYPIITTPVQFPSEKPEISHVWLCKLQADSQGLFYEHRQADVVIELWQGGQGHYKNCIGTQIYLE